MIQRPEILLGMLLPRAKNKDHLAQLAAMMSPPPTDAPVGAPATAPQQAGGIGPALVGQTPQPNPSMKVPAVPGMNVPNPGNPSIGAAIAGG